MKTTLISGFSAVILTILVCAWYLKRELAARPPSSTSTTISIDSSRVTHITNPATFLSTTTENPIPATVDTAAILRLFHQSHFYHQSIRDTISDVLAEISDTVRFNMLTHRTVNLRNLRATTITTTVFDTCKPYRAPLLQPYIGARIGVSRPSITQATPFIGLKIKGRWHADYGYNIPGKEHQVSVSRDIFGPVSTKK